ncbi:hypothetical protein GBF38_005516 [Nibea albiflora]|uniref:Uncharacterized protein n=1 Tax=Nibea albiflora TaxID=240163 RepID=A0ACB7EWB8_NIBAL|nr:hypothetical protein GBF38_005516 [Nibea albiflora]
MLLCLLLVPHLTAYGALLYANPGHNVTLPCFFGSSNVKYLSWYKQAAGETPQIISTFYKHSPDSNTFEGPFKDDKRFSAHPGKDFYHLNISNVQDSDSAMYYCGHTKITSTKFYNGTFLVLKEKRDDTLSVLTLCVVAALLVSIILNITLISMLCKTSRGTHLHSGGLQPQTSVRENTTDSQNEECDALPYVALDFKKRQSKSRRQRSPDEDTIYSGVRLSDMK